MDFEELYSRISPRLKRIAMHYRRRCRYLDEDDLYQEMCCYLWKRFGKRPEKDKSDYYIAKGCEYHLLNYMRVKKEKAVLCSLEEPINEKGDTIKDIFPSPCERLDRTVERKITFDTIMNNGFTKREKEILTLLLKGYTVREVGQDLGISHVMVVKSKKNLIRKWQKKGLAPDEILNDFLFAVSILRRKDSRITCNLNKKFHSGLPRN